MASRIYLTAISESFATRLENSEATTAMRSERVMALILPVEVGDAIADYLQRATRVAVVELCSCA